MNRCSTCKSWEPYDPTISVEKVHREEAKGGHCANVHLVEESPFESDNLVYSYDEGGSFWTGPNFGCVHHEFKPIEGHVLKLILNMLPENALFIRANQTGANAWEAVYSLPHEPGNELVQAVQAI